MNKIECENITRGHIELVRKYLRLVIIELLIRADEHDKSKLETPELEIFTKYTPKLSKYEYGSAEYKKNLKRMKPALKHHYANNPHHPEFHGGIKEMSLVDLLEMMCDWMAAVKRHDTGNIRESIEKNQKRFGYSNELKSILYNTIKFIEAKKEKL